MMKTPLLSKILSASGHGRWRSAIIFARTLGASRLGRRFPARRNQDVALQGEVIAPELWAQKPGTRQPSWSLLMQDQFRNVNAIPVIKCSLSIVDRDPEA